MKSKYLKEVKAMIPGDFASVPEASKVTGIGQRTPAPDWRIGLESVL